MKTVLFIPGFKEDLKSRDYASTIQAIKASGYKVQFVPVRWARTTIDDWVQEVELEYSQHNPKETILAGFSFGAMTAFMAATKQNPSELWLLSLSPYFKEDIRHKGMKKSWLNHIGHRRVTAFDKLSFQELAKTVRCKTLIFVGKIELDKWPDMKRRAVNAEKFIDDSKLFIVQDVGHDVSDKRYIEVIKQAI